MEKDVAPQFSVLGHPQRLGVFRLLMRRFPDHVPATELAQAMDLRPNTLSTYVNALVQAGLVRRERRGTSLRYSVDMEGTRDLVENLFRECCRGRPDICETVFTPTRKEMDVQDRKYKVLFICTGNSARSIFAESILRKVAADRFEVYSAGTKPKSDLNPFALEVLKSKDYDISFLRSKNVGEFQGADAPDFDFVFTVCDQAANEECPAWHGQPISAHWGMPDPVKATGNEAEKSLAFQQTYAALRNRIIAFAALPFDALDRLATQKAVDDIGQDTSNLSIE